MSITSAQIATVRQAVSAAGSTFPKAVTKALADRDKVAVAAAGYATARPDELGDAIVTCLLAGRDPADDEQVRHLTTSRAIAGASGGLLLAVQDAVERRLIAALRGSVDDLVGIFSSAAAAAGDKLANAHELIGDADLSDSGRILALGPDAARAWAEARDAQQLIRTIDAGWVALAALTGFADGSPYDATLRLADLDAETHEKVGRKAEPWDIVRAGGTIDLADAEALAERRDRLATERQQRDNARAAAARRPSLV